MRREGLSILVAAENFFIHHYFSCLFEKQHTLKAADSGREAIEALSRRHFNLVFINEYLPDMGTPELLDAIGRLRPKAKSIVMLTHREDADRLLKKHGAAGVMIKPFTVIDVLRITGKVLPSTQSKDLFCLDALRQY